MRASSGGTTIYQKTKCQEDNEMKKLFAFMLVLAMMATMCVSVFAREPDDPDACNCEEPWPENPR